MRVRSFVVVVVVAVPAGCSPFGESTSAPGAAASSMGDASAEAGGAVDAGAADAGRVRACPGAVVVADGFDRDVAASGGWTLEGDPVGITTDDGSPAPSLAVAAPALTEWKSVTRLLWRTVKLPTDRPTLCIELDARVVASKAAYSGGAFSEIIAVDPDVGPTTWFEVLPSGLALTGDGSNDAPLASYAFGQWRHVVLRLPFGTGQASVDVDGKTTTLDGTLDGAPTEAVVGIGLNSWAKDGTTGAIAVGLDNVVITVSP